VEYEQAIAARMGVPASIRCATASLIAEYLLESMNSAAGYSLRQPSRAPPASAR
jgi:hypothetical protein